MNLITESSVVTRCNERLQKKKQLFDYVILASLIASSFYRHSLNLSVADYD